MALNEQDLTTGERIVMELREHPKALLWPFVLLLVLLAGGAASFLVPVADVVRWIALGVLALVAVVWVILPWARWHSSSYSVTNRRIAMRTGLITRTGRDIPLYRVNDIALEKDLVDRILGCGTLVVSDATEKAGMVLHDVPRVDDVHVQLQELLHAHDDGSDDGEFPPTEPPRGPRR
ncbi:PH domain-containing protein [Isoptericola sp. NEAU-Y5]|uniref:PH domain-containing protein n=1 Tax=Isoptericola luteus TaxID=2879484 RepID=A0ABS7ZA07_9MICO|nr:PH domain-containing protein [Isoptericola sp. NEAU-Y5]MCA5891886.1 PH domain-containing protein [Isoptericola sp. NEAU-Y5]